MSKMDKMEIKNGKLIITIEVDTLDIEHIGTLVYPHQGKVVVTDTKDALESMRDALLNEEEDGTTPVDKLLDEALKYAIEQGFEGIDFIEDDDEML